MKISSKYEKFLLNNYYEKKKLLRKNMYGIFEKFTCSAFQRYFIRLFSLSVAKVTSN